MHGVTISKDDKLRLCQARTEGKTSHDPFPVGKIRTTKKLQLVHSDVCGPMQAIQASEERTIASLS